MKQYTCLLSESPNTNEGKRVTNNPNVANKTRKERKKFKRKAQKHDIFEANKKHIKKLSNIELTSDQVNLVAKGLKFIPTPVTTDNLIRRQLLQDFNDFARRMRLQYIFHGKNEEPHPFHLKSNWEPPVQPSVALESYLVRVKFQLAKKQFSKPKNNLPAAERKALKNLKNNTEINIKKADKGTTSVFMSFADKNTEGQIQLDNIEHYRPLDEPMVEETPVRVEQLITELYREQHIDEMTKKWLCQTQNPPRIPVFYTLTKIHKPTPVGRPIISGVPGPTERLSAFVDKLLQPIAQQQKSYLKDTTDFINFMDGTRVPENTILVSMDVTSQILTGGGNPNSMQSIQLFL